MKTEKYILQNSRTEWYLTAGGHHTSNPESIYQDFRFPSAEAAEAYRDACRRDDNYDVVKFSEAKEIE